MAKAGKAAPAAKPTQKRRGLSLKKWQLLVQVFREQGPHISYREAARLAGVQQATAKQNFEKGTPSLRRPPIKDVLLQEQIEARAKVEVATSHIESRMEALGGDLPTRKAAEKNAKDTMAQEGRLVAGARMTAEICLVAAGRLLKSTAPLVEAITRETTKALQDSKSSYSDLEGILRRTFGYAKEAVALARASSELERLHLGAPEKTIAVTTTVTADEAVEEVAALIRMMSRLDTIADPDLAADLARAGVDLRHLRVIRGGKQEDDA